MCDGCAARSIVDRREGRDASEQEDERLARADLQVLHDSVSELTAQRNTLRRACLSAMLLILLRSLRTT